MSSPKFTSLIAAGLLLGVAALPLRAELAAGAAFPKLSEAQLEGTLPDTAGKVVLVDFWASWCGPCKESFPALAQLQSQYAGKGVVVLGVSVDEKAAAYAAFVKRHAPPFPTVRDQAQKLVATVKVPAMPTSYVIGRDGRVRAVFAGFHGAETEKAVRAAIDSALAEPTS